MKNSRLFISSLMMAMALYAQARPISHSEAYGIASGFIAGKAHSGHRTPVLKSTLNPDTDSPYYVFNAEDGKGFIIISGDDRLGPVLGYSDNGQFSLNDAPDGLKSLMALYKAYINGLPDSNTHSTISAPGIPSMTPLLGDINWGQDYPFNESCPTYTSGSTTKHYYVGCVATAATQIMRFYNHPARGTGSKSCTVNGISLSADFGNTEYDWTNMPATMPDSPTAAQIKASSTLAAHFGVAVEMQYAQGGSGAYTQLVPMALRDYFGYDTSLRLHVREYYSTSEWVNMLKSELDAGRPVYYGATSDNGSGGHAFVLDGYDSNDYFHVNWGWYGRSNGYFLINHLSPDELGEGGGYGSYNVSQEAITGIRPSLGGSDRETAVYGAVRLSFTPYNDTFTLMTFMENHDVNKFTGKIGGVLTDPSTGNIVKVLSSQQQEVDGFSGGRTGAKMVTLRDIPASAQGVPDGDYHLNIGICEQGSDSWRRMRHPIGLPGYVKVTVKSGVISGPEGHVPHPDVKLLEQISTDGEVYAGGAAMFTLKLDNRSQDFRLSDITLKLTSVDNPSSSFTTSSKVNIYDESIETVSLLMILDSDINPGEYEVTAYETSAPDYVFDDSEAGRAVITVHEATSEPVMRLTSTPIWQGLNATTTINQDDLMGVAVSARNYGPEGTARMLMRMEDITDSRRCYVFSRVDRAVKPGDAVSLTFSRRVPVDPGTYKIQFCSVDGDGDETPLEHPGEPVTITIGSNPEIAIDAVATDIPSELKLGVSGTYTFTVRARLPYSGYVYLRMHQFNQSAAGILTMSRVTLAAGEEKQITFKYTPEAVGRFILVGEAPSGKAIGNIDGYYREITVTDPSGIDDITGGTANGPVVGSSEGEIIISGTYSTAAVYTISGVRMDSLKVPAGLYIVVVDGKASKVLVR